MQPKPLCRTTPAAELDVRAGYEKMGFHQDWGQCTDQLAALAAKR